MSTTPEKSTADFFMDKFFATTSYNASEDWRKEPLTFADPDDEPPTEDKEQQETK
jgi:hypothetical protein